MAVYKVPQDVEAEDKLIGPFSFRQFIYLIIAALGGFLAYGLGQLFWALGIIPVPIILFFLVMALPLKKDQPMETYLTAVVRFFLKPRIRLWSPEGEISLVEITAKKVEEGPVLKDFSGNEASERLRYLSQVVDTGGWASRGLTSPMDSISLSDTVMAEAQGATDVLDTGGSVAQNFDSMIAQSDQARKAAMIQSMQNSVAPQTQQVATPAIQPTAIVQPTGVQTVTQTYTTLTAPQSQPEDSSGIVFNPYPTSIRQKVINPSGSEPPVTPPSTAQQAPPPAPPATNQQAQAPSEEQLSPDIMRLAASKDLSISTIAREAERLQKKHLDEEEVVVSLR